MIFWFVKKISKKVFFLENLKILMYFLNFLSRKFCSKLFKFHFFLFFVLNERHTVFYQRSMRGGGVNSILWNFMAPNLSCSVLNKTPLFYLFSTMFDKSFLESLWAEFAPAVALVSTPVRFILVNYRIHRVSQFRDMTPAKIPKFTLFSLTEHVSVAMLVEFYRKLLWAKSIETVPVCSMITLLQTAQYGIKNGPFTFEIWLLENHQKHAHALFWKLRIFEFFLKWYLKTQRTSCTEAVPLRSTYPTVLPATVLLPLSCSVLRYDSTKIPKTASLLILHSYENRVSRGFATVISRKSIHVFLFKFRRL